MNCGLLLTDQILVFIFSRVLCYFFVIILFLSASVLHAIMQDENTGNMDVVYSSTMPTTVHPTKLLTCPSIHVSKRSEQEYASLYITQLILHTCIQAGSTIRHRKFSQRV